MTWEPRDHTDGGPWSSVERHLHMEARCDLYGVDAARWSLSRASVRRLGGHRRIQRRIEPLRRGWAARTGSSSPTIQEVRTLTGKPLVVTEVASTEASGDKAAWISDLVKTVAERHALSGFIWVGSAREADWRIASSADSAKAFAAGIADRRFGPAPVP